jgi:hypothetical protein
MPRYMVLVLDTVGIARGGIPVNHVADQDALDAAERVIEQNNAAEVWQSNRLVGRIYGQRYLGPRS